MSIKKGGAFEKEVAKELSLWWTNGERDDIFYRTSGSGSRATVRHLQGKQTSYSAGDIGIIDPDGSPFLDFFLVEAKKGYSKDKASKKLCILDLIDSKQKKPVLAEWIDKAEKECQQNERYEILIIFKRDRKQECVLLSSDLLTRLTAYCDYYKKGMFIELKNYGYSIMKFRHFLEWVDPETIRLFANGEDD